MLCHLEPLVNRPALRLGLALLVLLAASVGRAAEAITFAPDDHRDIANPERGLYLQYTSQAENDPLTLEELQTLHDKRMTLVLRMFYFKTFRDRPLSDKQLDIIRHDFNVIRQAGLKCVPRFAYSQNIGEPDAPIDIVLHHMDQLAPILKDNADIILAAQAGFIGAWGEWHSSTNHLSDPENARKIVNRWLEILPPTRDVQLRTPRQKWMILNSRVPLKPTQAFNGSPAARIGHHNDCFVSSDTDVGTYEDIETEKRYLHLDTRYAPMGGETCALTKFADPDNARKELENLHFTFLNLGWHPDVIKLWQTSAFFKEVKRRLGYRLSLVSLNCPQTIAHGDTLKLVLSLKNTGFAAPVNPRNVELILVNKADNQSYTLKLPTDPRTWLPGKPIDVNAELNLPDDVKAGTYALYLALPDPEPKLHDRPEYAIQLANPDLFDPATGRHDLGTTLVVGE